MKLWMKSSLTHPLKLRTDFVGYHQVLKTGIHGVQQDVHRTGQNLDKPRQLDSSVNAILIDNLIIFIYLL